MSIFDVPINDLVTKTASELKQFKEVKPPIWSVFVKTGMAKERPPENNDWWFVRAASILRKLQILGPVGVSKLRTIYGSRKNNGYAPEHHYRAAGNNLRKILQQLEKAGLAKQTKKDVHKGRVLTPKGISLLEKVSAKIMKEKNIVIPKKAV